MIPYRLPAEGIMTVITVLGEFDEGNATHRATNAALEHSAARLGAEVDIEWLATDSYRDGVLADSQALFVAPGSPYRDFAAALAAIRWARENALPTLGTCGGFQHMMVEYARSVLGIDEAGHAEVDPNASVLFISGLYCSLVGRALEITLRPDSQVAGLYGATLATEQYYCNFGVNPDYVARLAESPLVVSGSDTEGEVRVIELPGHPFYVGTLFVPQARSTAARPHPLVTGFVAVAARASLSG